ncbi:hypothetical protein GE21DRAFT_1019464 [Neurospora crassa]|nr:hypothetical protein GE21DRAFT_1019464 [Neurospora crassa]
MSLQGKDSFIVQRAAARQRTPGVQSLHSGHGSPPSSVDSVGSIVGPFLTSLARSRPLVSTAAATSSPPGCCPPRSPSARPRRWPSIPDLPPPPSRRHPHPHTHHFPFHVPVRPSCPCDPLISVRSLLQFFFPFTSPLAGVDHRPSHVQQQFAQSINRSLRSLNLINLDDDDDDDDDDSIRLSDPELS